MAGNCGKIWKWLELMEMAGNGCKLLEQLEIAGND